MPRGSYPTPFLGRLLFKITDPNHKTRYPKKGVGYEPLGGFEGVALLRDAALQAESSALGASPGRPVERGWGGAAGQKIRN